MFHGYVKLPEGKYIRCYYMKLYDSMNPMELKQQNLEILGDSIKKINHPLVIPQFLSHRKNLALLTEEL